MRYGTRVTANDVLWTWLFRHAAWLRTRHGRRAGGQSPYECAFGMPYRETWHESVKRSHTASLILTVGILQKISHGRLAERSPCGCAILQSVAGVPWAPRVHDVRGRPRKQPDLPIEVTTLPLGADEVPAVDPSQGVPQNYVPSIEQWRLCTDDAGSKQRAGRDRT